VRYEWKEDKGKLGVQIGLIAQEVEKDRLRKEPYYEGTPSSFTFANTLCQKPRLNKFPFQISFKKSTPYLYMYKIKSTGL
jgi:hypothetical protein